MTINRDAILRVLTEEDVEGLLGVGAPLDEYSAEAQLIAEEVARLGTQEILTERIKLIVVAVCVRMFGPFDEHQLAARMPTYERIAQRIARDAKA